MQLLKEPQTKTKKVPRWLAKFVLLQTQNKPDNRQILLGILEPMTPQEWCYFWIPIIHPGVEVPYDGERNPHGYMKACTATLSALTGYNPKTVEGWFYGKSYHYSVGILLRCFHLIFQFYT